MSHESAPRPYIVSEANYRQLLDNRPTVAVLPWGATEAHNYHLPHGTDNYEAVAVAEEAARIAIEQGAKVAVLPVIPFGNNAQQVDQVATIHFSTATAGAILADVLSSLKRQGIDRLVILNGHGGNNFTGLVRDAQLEHEMLIVVVDFYDLRLDAFDEIFDDPGDHADEMETSFIMHLRPELVQMENAGPGERVAFEVEGLQQSGVWTPRPWSHSHPDTGSGSPEGSTPEKGERYLAAISAAAAEVFVGLSNAKPGELPYRPGEGASQ